MNRVPAAVAAPLLLLGALAGCGASGSKTIEVAYAPPGSEADCQAATVRLLQAVPGVADPGMDAATVRERVGHGAPACLGFDGATLDRLYAAAIPEFLASPSAVNRATAQPTEVAGVAEADTPTATPKAASPKAEDRTEQCRAAIRKIVKAGIVTENAGGDREAGEERATAEVEKDRPCKGVSSKGIEAMYTDAEREFGGSR